MCALYVSPGAAMDEDAANVYIVVGYPGAGKGTFSQALKKRGFKHFSSGDILRDELANKTPIGLKYEEEIKTGKFLPTEVVQEVIHKKVSSSIQEQHPIVLDGYPRTYDQSLLLSEYLRKLNFEKNVLYVYIKVDPERASERILTRLSCSKCGALFNSLTCPPTKEDFCDYCGGDLKKRESDNTTDVAERMETYKSHLPSLLEHIFTKCHYLTFDGNRPIGECVLDYENLHGRTK